jgi:tRNA(Ile)-lysidine synthase
MHPVQKAFSAAMAQPPIAPLCRGIAAVFVAYSGGADSTALLTLMHAYCMEHGLSCTAIHVHHGIRGAEADRDADACSAFCRERGIPLILKRRDVPAYAEKHHIGMEEAARTVRYAVFDEILADRKDAVLATAHSADDQLETVLHHLLRGSGIDGLCGIPPVRGALIRPLLTVSAADIRDFCRTSALPFVEDSTNTDEAYTRNYIRREIVPRLRQITSAPETAITRMCALLREDAAYLDKAAVAALRDYANASLAPEEYLKDLPDALLSRAIIHLYENETGKAENLTSAHIAAVMALVRRGGSGKIPLPGGRFARLEYGNLDFRPEQTYPEAPPADFCVSLHMGENLFPEFGFGIRMEEYAQPPDIDDPAAYIENIKFYKLFIWYSFPYDTIQGEISMRFLRPGDRIRQGGMTRQVRKLFNQYNVSPQWRIRCPILCDSAGILWIPRLGGRDTDHPKTGRSLVFSYFTL